MNDFEYEIDDSEVTITGYTGNGGDVTVLDTIDGFSVTTIGDSAFQKCTGLTRITLPNSITDIGWFAFQECTSLTSITLPNSLTTIGDFAFDSCTGLTSITLGNSITTIGSWAFSGCSGLNSITLPNSVTTIGSWAFSGCSGLNSITLPNSVTDIEESVFEGCTGLTSVTLPNSISTIEGKAFEGCTGLTSITFGNSLTDIEEYAFQGCISLTSITLGNSVTDIGDAAFQGCTGLTSITLPDSVTDIGDAAFQGCTGLTSITLGNSVTDIGDAAFQGCTSLTSITLPDSVTDIGEFAFWECTSLTSITLPDSITDIGEFAFWECTSLTRRTPGLKEGSNDKEVKKGDVSKSELCLFCGVLNKSGKNDVCKHRIGWVDKRGLTRSDQMESLESVWTSLAGKIEQIRAYTQKGLAEKSGASLKTIRLFLKNVEEDHAAEFDSSGDSSGGVDSDTVFPPIFGLCGGEMDCQTKKGIPCLKSNFIYCKDPDSLEEHISDLELLNEFLDEEENEEDGRDSENCPFCDALNFWGEMEVCEHHIGMAFDGVIESENLERLKNVWMSLAEKIEKIKEFTQKKLAEKSGASLKTIRLLLKNVDEDHAYDLYSEEFFPPIFDLCWGGENVQSQGMLSGSSQSIYCQDPGALENHISGLERLDKVIEKPDPPIEES